MKHDNRNPSFSHLVQSFSHLHVHLIRGFPSHAWWHHKVFLHYYPIKIPIVTHLYSNHIPSIYIPPIFHWYTTNIPFIFHQYSMHKPPKFHSYSSNIPFIFHDYPYSITWKNGIFPWTDLGPLGHCLSPPKTLKVGDIMTPLEDALLSGNLVIFAWFHDSLAWVYMLLACFSMF